MTVMLEHPAPAAAAHGGGTLGRCQAEVNPGVHQDAFTTIALASRCPNPAVMTIRFECKCRHSGHRNTCAPHGQPGPEQAHNCSPCAEEGHWCLVTVEQAQ